jgi:hypothetical protein
VTQKSPPRIESLAGILSKIRLESLEVRPPIEMMAMVMMMLGDGQGYHRPLILADKMISCPGSVAGESVRKWDWLWLCKSLFGSVGERSIQTNETAYSSYRAACRLPEPLDCKWPGIIGDV